MTPRELVIDSFAGGGGVSLGIEQAIGRHVDIAINHDREAVATFGLKADEYRPVRES